MIGVNDDLGEVEGNTTHKNFPEKINYNDDQSTDFSTNKNSNHMKEVNRIHLVKNENNNILKKEYFFQNNFYHLRKLWQN